MNSTRDDVWVRNLIEPTVWYQPDYGFGTDETSILRALDVPDGQESPGPEDEVRVYCYPNDQPARALALCTTPRCNQWRNHRLVGSPYVCSSSASPTTSSSWRPATSPSPPPYVVGTRGRSSESDVDVANYPETKLGSDLPQLIPFP
jgi:hypothetical protein